MTPTFTKDADRLITLIKQGNKDAILYLVMLLKLNETSTVKLIFEEVYKEAPDAKERFDKAHREALEKIYVDQCVFCNKLATGRFLGKAICHCCVTKIKTSPE